MPDHHHHQDMERWILLAEAVWFLGSLIVVLVAFYRLTHFTWRSWDRVLAVARAAAGWAAAAVSNVVKFSLLVCVLAILAVYVAGVDVLLAAWARLTHGAQHVELPPVDNGTAWLESMAAWTRAGRELLKAKLVAINDL